MVKKADKKILEIQQIKNSLKANEDILRNHPNLKDSIETENQKLNERLKELEKQ